MADAYFIVTLSSADDGSGPNYDVLYSTDCISYSPANPATITLEYVGAQGTITVPDNTQCVKLTNINSNCTNSVTSSVNITTTTTTTAAPTTTTTTAAGTTTTTTTTTLGPSYCWKVYNPTEGSLTVEYYNTINEPVIAGLPGDSTDWICVYGGTTPIDYEGGGLVIEACEIQCTSSDSCTGCNAPTTTTTTTTTTTGPTILDWQYIHERGATGTMTIYVNGIVIETRSTDSNDTWPLSLGDVINVEVSTGACSGGNNIANAYTIGDLNNDSACGNGSTSLTTTGYTVVSGDIGTTLILNVYSTCDAGCV
jgi:hypothetical protein